MLVVRVRVRVKVRVRDRDFCKKCNTSANYNFRRFPKLVRRPLTAPDGYTRYAEDGRS